MRRPCAASTNGPTLNAVNIGFAVSHSKIADLRDDWAWLERRRAEPGSGARISPHRRRHRLPVHQWHPDRVRDRRQGPDVLIVSNTGLGRDDRQPAGRSAGADRLAGPTWTSKARDVMTGRGPRAAPGPHRRSRRPRTDHRPDRHRLATTRCTSAAEGSGAGRPSQVAIGSRADHSQRVPQGRSGTVDRRATTSAFVEGRPASPTWTRPGRLPGPPRRRLRWPDFRRPDPVRRPRAGALGHHPGRPGACARAGHRPHRPAGGARRAVGDPGGHDADGRRGRGPGRARPQRRRPRAATWPPRAA